MNKCKGCEWYGKPYWSIINPCDNCPRDNVVEKIEVFSHWIDPSIEELQQRIDKAIKYIETAIYNRDEIFGTELLQILKGEE